jgi:nicotinate-nucleotide pyrophosphorylase (carboxylating)
MTRHRVLGRFAAPFPPPEILDPLIRTALDEDAAFEDRSLAAIPENARGSGRVLAKEPGILAGERAFRRVFEILSPAARYEHQGAIDGHAFAAGDVVLTIAGPARALLSGERTALNFLQRLSGIATKTRGFVDKAGGRIAITDTRKTTPGLRALEKYAVVVGGGVSHRRDLREMAMLKENHIALAGGIRRAVESIRTQWGTRELPLTVEVRTFEEAMEAADLEVDRILLDNMDPAQMRRIAEALGPRRSRPELEASGGIREENLDEIASSGVDVASIGSLTHGVRSIDFSFLVERIAVSS